MSDVERRSLRFLRFSVRKTFYPYYYSIYIQMVTMTTLCRTLFYFSLSTSGKTEKTELTVWETAHA